MNKLLAGLLGFAVVLGAGAFFLQRATNAELREEIAGLRGDVQQLANSAASRLRAEAAARQGAAVAVVPAVSPRADEDRAELAKMRDEIAALKKSAQEIVRTAQASTQNSGQSTVPVNLIPSGAWKNAGRATPSAAVETLLWAAAGGDVETISGLITLEPAAQTKAEALFAHLPEATRAQYGSPEKLVALFLARDAAAISGMQILGQRDVTSEVVGVRVRLANENGKSKETSFAFQKAQDGLRLRVPDDVVEKYAQQLAGGGGK